MASLEMTKSLEELVAWIQEETAGAALGSDEITTTIYGEAIGASRQAARYHLDRLVESGKMEVTKKIVNGRRQVVYRRVG